MINKNYLLIVIIGVFSSFMTSCSLDKGVNIKINNSSNLDLKNIIISTSENLEKINYKKIDIGDSTSSFLKMDNNQSDGAYVLEFEYSDGRKINKSFGYYTNGVPLEKEVEFIIKNDTILFYTK